MKFLRIHYRNISWKEAQLHIKSDENRTEAIWESECRGRLITIQIPHIAMGPSGLFICQCPLYIIPEKGNYVCPHIAEIGD